jgi:hypothetical protein
MSESAITSVVTALISAAGAVIVALIHNRRQADTNDSSRSSIVLPGGREIRISPASSPGRILLFALLAALLGGVVGYLLGGFTVLPGSTRVALRTHHDTYAVALDASERWLVKASNSDVDTCAVFTLVWLDRADNVVALRTCHGRYVTAMDDQPGWDWELRAETGRIGGWETFTLVDLDGDLKALETAHGRYVTAMDNQPGWDWELRAETDKIGEWEEFEFVPQLSFPIAPVVLVAALVVVGLIVAAFYLIQKRRGKR